MTISYAITAVNEHKELEHLLDQINRVIRDEDEVMVQLDSNATEEVKEVAIKYNVGTTYNYHRIFFPLNNDFASFKNNLKDHCTRDYIFFIDADEFMSINLELSLAEILELNPEVDLFSVPRINTVFNIGLNHVEQWGWNISKNKDYISERELDMDNPADLDHYNLLKQYNLIINEVEFS